MKTIIVFVSIIFAIFFVLSPLTASSTSILVSNYISNGVVSLNYLYGSSSYSNMTNLLENIKGNKITMVPNFENLCLMLQYDAIWLQLRDRGAAGPYYDFSGHLSDTELNNIETFIDHRGRVLMNGEWGGWPYDPSIGWQKWDNQILSVVGGTYGTSYGDEPVAINPISISNDKLTKNVNELDLIGNRYGTANGGTALFDPNIASLWGKHENVLIVLDVGFFSDLQWNEGDNAQFATNIAEWLSHRSVKPIPEPSTMLLLASGLAGLRVLRKKFKR